MGVVTVGLALLLLQDKIDTAHGSSPWLPGRPSLARPGSLGVPRVVYTARAAPSSPNRRSRSSSWARTRYRTIRGGSLEEENSWNPSEDPGDENSADFTAPRGGGVSVRTMKGITTATESAESVESKESHTTPPGSATFQEQTAFYGAQHPQNGNLAPTTTITRFNSTDGAVDKATVVASDTVVETDTKIHVASANTTIPLVAATLAKRKDSEQSPAAKAFAKKLKNRNHLHLPRKFFHAGFGLVFAILNNVVPRKMFVASMAAVSFCTLLTELLRYREGFGWMNDLLFGILGAQLRKHEMEGKFTGSFYFFTGVTLTAATLPTGPASLGIMQLAIADPSASYFGQRTRDVYWSRIQNGLGGIGRNKGLLGFLGGALMCVPFNYRALSLAKWGSSMAAAPSASQLVLASLALGVAGSFADLAVPTPAVMLPAKVGSIQLPPFHMDDNFVVPIFSGWACSKFFSTLGWPTDLQLSKFVFL